MKKILLSLGTATAIIVPLASMVSCEIIKKDPNSNGFFSTDFIKSLQKHKFADDIKETYTLEQIKSEFGESVIHDATMGYWIDGDTPVVNDITPSIEGQTSNHIRIESIDTPELHTDGVLTTGDELKYAQKAKEFGEQEIPIGTNFKLISDGSASYKRIVGSLFYQTDPTQEPNDGETTYKSYAVQIIKNGLCLPFMDDSAIGTKGSIANFIGSSFANSYNWAIKNKKGMFSGEINEILGVHGATNDTQWRWRSVWPEDEPANAFDRLDLIKKQQ